MVPHGGRCSGRKMKLEAKILLLSLLAGVGSSTTSWFWTTAFDSCWSNCGYELSSCSCASSCVYNGNCCHDYRDYCYQTTHDILLTTGVVGSCGGTYTQQSGEFASPQYPSNYPNYAHCSWRIQSTGTKIIRLAFTYVQIESGPDCKYDAVRVYDGPSTSYPLLGVLCGSQTRTFFSSGNDLTVVFSSDSSTTYQGFVANWVFEEPPPYTTDQPHTTEGLLYTTEVPPVTTEDLLYTTEASPSCRWNCGYNLGSCSCSSSCQYYGNCCHDYHDYCYDTTPDPYPTTASPSCRWNCGYNLGSCSCSSSCQYYGNCCHDYHDYCYTTTYAPDTTSESPSCRWNCGYNLGSCSCSSSCQYYGNCCHDYHDYCDTTTTTESPSCRWNCGYNLGSCSCSSSCQYYGNCCHDYHDYCYTTTYAPDTTSESPSCRWNCGYNLGSCSCSSSCQYYGNCCHDYHDYCDTTTTTGAPDTTTESPSCRWNCGYNLGSCSCSSSCQYYGNCCHDYHDYCSTSTSDPYPPVTHPTCGGRLFDSGSISSPYYPNYYHDNAYCVWQLSAPAGQRIFLSFVDLELERCCNCDYIYVYDGSTTASSLLGKLCYNDTTLRDFRSSSSYMTVLFRSDGSGVARGFKASFSSSLPENTGKLSKRANSTIAIGVSSESIPNRAL
ncbi:deleted in malignant brain tumors 1 protein-like isoform X2 [Colossoma macropomum]|uniref:deleted in malignant brain tumors 1 protein-like isoform X2 n=1 Tax=Colossoma macropomum TaxID=42526 RepID=UPI00186469EB|nr:deleted in malignant brain tumors 1 protein-like isoform X2 [Colossoma macropomum]